MPRPRRRRRGLIPWLGTRVVAFGGMLARHPQPFIFCLVILAALWVLWSGAQEADAFRVTTIQVPPEVVVKLPKGLIGQNLWSVDIRSLAEELQHQQPAFQHVRVVRRPPSAIAIVMVPRTPVAQVYVRQRWHPVDADGFVLSRPVEDADGPLVRLTGVTNGEVALSVGAVNASGRLRAALGALRVVQADAAFRSHRVREVNVAELQQIRLMLEPSTEVRCGSLEELPVHLQRLAEVLRVIERQGLAVRSIDVRFPEPVVEPAAPSPRT